MVGPLHRNLFAEVLHGVIGHRRWNQGCPDRARCHRVRSDNTFLAWTSSACSRFLNFSKISKARLMGCNQASTSSSMTCTSQSGSGGVSEFQRRSMFRRPLRGLRTKRMIKEKTQHFPRRVRPPRIGVGAGRAATRPRMASTMNVPLFRDHPPVSVC